MGVVQESGGGSVGHGGIGGEDAGPDADESGECGGWGGKEVRLESEE